MKILNPLAELIPNNNKETKHNLESYTRGKNIDFIRNATQHLDFRFEYC